MFFTSEKKKKWYVQSESRTMFFQEWEKWYVQSEVAEVCEFRAKIPAFNRRLRPRFSNYLKLNRYVVGRGSAYWGCLIETRFSWSSVSYYCLSSQSNFWPILPWAFTNFEHWCRLFLGEKWGSGMCCRNCSTSAATDAMTITNSTSQAEINSRRWLPYQECIGSFS